MADVTKRLFLRHLRGTPTAGVFTSDRLGSAVQILPKRGLSTVDPEPLRTLLAAHSRRLPRTG